MKKNNLEKIIETMKNPGVYPHPVKDIKLVQTQMSCVFLTGDYVYKIKKPVNLGFLDYTTLEKRKKLCEREVELNRRLAPEVYLGIVPICQYQGKILLQSRGPTFVPPTAGLRRGKVIEYAVKMRQLPADKILSFLLKQNKVTKETIKKIAKKIANFHQRAEASQKIAKYGSLKIINKNCQENFEQTKKYVGITISTKDYQKIKSWTENFIAKNPSLFKKRIKDEKIRDCHGDLQSDHICLCGRKIYIYDCIEFNERFRYGDVASEIAFLAMDLDFHGCPEFSDYFLRSYVKNTGDKDILKLINFYKCYRAYVLGKVRSFKSDDPMVSKKEREAAKNLAKKYFKLAHSYICQKPTLIVICGLSGTGKTTVSKILTKNTGFEYISSDVVRKKMAKIPLFERRKEEFNKGIYAPKFSQKNYKAIFKQAEDFLGKGKSVIIDASFKKRKNRKKARGLAKKMGVDFLFVECWLPDKIVKRKMEKRVREKTVSDADWKIYLKQKKDFDKITEIPLRNHLIIGTFRISDEKIIQKVKEKISENKRQAI